MVGSPVLYTKHEVPLQAENSAGNLLIYFANVTKLGTKAFDYLVSRRSHIKGAAETHFSTDATAKFFQGIRKQNMRGVASVPRRGDGADTEKSIKGGVAAFWQRHANVQPVESLPGSEFLFEGDKEFFQDFVAVVKRSSFGLFLVIFGYLNTYEGFSGENLRLLSKWSTLIRVCKLPYILMADFNHTPDEMLESGWISAMGGCIITPTGSSFTCNNSARRMIDFAVISSSLVSRVSSFEVDVAVPWSPHYGIQMALAANAKGVPRHVLTSPTPLRALPVFCQGGGEVPWVECVLEACSLKGASHPREDSPTCHSLGPFHSHLERQAKALAGEFQKWSLPSELQLLYRKGFERAVIRGPDAHKLVGRGNFVNRVKVSPGQESLDTCPYRPHFSIGDSRVQYWSRIRNVCKSLTVREPTVIHKALAAFKSLTSMVGDYMPRDEMIDEVAKWQQRSDDASNMTLELLDVKSWVLEAEQMVKTVTSQRVKDSRQSFASWLKSALLKGSGPAHRHCNVWGQLPMVPQHKVFEGRLVTEPDKVMQIRADEWVSRWRRHAGASDSDISDIVRSTHRAALKHLEEYAGSEETKITIGHLKRGLKRFAKGTAPAANGWSPSDLLDLSDESLEMFAEILQKVLSAVTLPATDLLVLIVFLGKPGGGERPIALLGLVYRVIASIKRPASVHWCDRHAGHWDMAVRKSSALRAALARNFRAEVAHLIGDEAVLALWDIEKFYDSISITDVAEMGMRMNYPPVELALACQAHTAPRMLKAEDVVSCIYTWIGY